MYVTLNYQLISWIEQEKDLKLTLPEIVFLSAIDSFRKQSRPCQMTKKAVMELCRTKRTITGNMFRNLKKHNIIKIYYPANQQGDFSPCTFWLHEDILSIIKELNAASKAVSPNDIGPVSKAVSPDDTQYNKDIGDSSSPFEGDSSSQHTEQNWLNSFSL